MVGIVIHCAVAAHGEDTCGKDKSAGGAAASPLALVGVGFVLNQPHAVDVIVGIEHRGRVDGGVVC